MQADSMLLAAVRDRLEEAGCVAAEEEAAELVEAAADRSTLEGWLARREQGEPPAWITGRHEFNGRSLRLLPGVFVPRYQTEALARRAAALLPAVGRAVDLCTGSGAVAAHLAAEAPGADVVGVELDPLAARCAAGNGVATVLGDLDAPVGADGTFDLVTAVPPYVPTAALEYLPADVQRYEPRLALDGGAGGLVLLRRVVVAARRLLRAGGWLVVELGAAQDVALAPILEVNGFGAPDRRWDEDGDLRGLAAQRLGGSRAIGGSAPGAVRG